MISWQLKNHFNSSPSHYYYSALFISFLALICYLFEDLIGYQAIGFIFLLGVLSISLVFSLGPIMFSAFISALIWDFFFILPYGTFFISRTEDIMMCLAYFMAAIITGILTSRIRQQRKALEDREEKTQLLYGISRELVSQKHLDKAFSRVFQQLEKTFSGNFFIIPALENELKILNIIGLKKEIDENELAVAKWVYKKRESAGPSTKTLPASDGLYIPLETSYSVVGVLGYLPDSAYQLSGEQLNLLYLVSREIALILERGFAEEKLKEAERLEMKEKLYQALFSSISHELKTPLTTIIGTASALSTLEANATTGLKQELMNELLDSAEKLKYIIDNLLDMTRIQAEKLILKTDWYDLRDILNSIIKKNTRTLKDFHLNIEYPDELPLILVDYKLLEQAIANIILNAASYSPPYSEITIKCTSHQDYLFLSIADEGIGIPEQEREKVLEKFYRGSTHRISGTGLGLYISKQIFDLHHIKLKIEDGDNNQGAKFIISIPINAEK